MLFRVFEFRLNVKFFTNLRSVNLLVSARNIVCCRCQMQKVIVVIATILYCFGRLQLVYVDSEQQLNS
jgi:hypothetical protein